MGKLTNALELVVQSIKRETANGVGGRGDRPVPCVMCPPTAWLLNFIHPPSLEGTNHVWPSSSHSNPGANLELLQACARALQIYTGVSECRVCSSKGSWEFHLTGPVGRVLTWESWVHFPALTLV